MSVKVNFSSNGVNSLLNNNSQVMKIKIIAIEDIVRNNLNTVSIEDIESLAYSIEDVGLLQPLMVKPIDDDKYMLIGGERRFTAIKYLIDKGNEKYENIPCTVIDVNLINLPLSNVLKEKYAIATTNIETRGFVDGASDFDLMETISLLKEVYSALKKEGYSLKGRQRDIIADNLNISARQVQRYEYIQNNLSDDFKQKLKQKQVPLTVAVDIAKLETDEQTALLKSVDKKEEITQKDVDSFKEKIVKKDFKTEIASLLTQEIYTKDKTEFSGLLSSLNSLCDNLKEPLNFEKKEYVDLLCAVEGAKFAISKIQKVVDKAQKKYN